jgi:hypothetical protein
MDGSWQQWDRQPFGVERRCTCTSRSAECGSRGWHLVDGWSTADEARADAHAMHVKFGVAYRAIDCATLQPI